MSPALNQSSKVDRWGEPIPGQGASPPPLVWLAVAIATLGFLAGPFRWAPIVAWFDPVAGTSVAGLLNVTSLACIFPACLLSYSALAFTPRDHVPARPLTWLATLLFLCSGASWFGKLAMAVPLPRLVLLIACGVIALTVIVHLVVLASESRAGFVAVGSLLALSLMLAPLAPWLVQAREKSRRLSVQRNLIEEGHRLSAEASTKQLPLEDSAGEASEPSSTPWR